MADDTMPTPAEAPVPTYPAVYWLTLLGIALYWIAMALLFWNTDIPMWGTPPINLGALMLVLGVLHFAAGFQIVDANQLAGVFVLGVPTIEVSGGPVIVPPLLCWTIRVDFNVQEMEIPDEPEFIFRAKEDDRVTPPGYRPPIRIPFANPPQNDTSGIDKSDPLHRRTTNEVPFFVRMQVTRGGFFNFYVRIGSWLNARRQVEDMGVSLLNDELTKLTPAMALQQLAEKSQQLENHIREKTKTWGVNVLTARIKQIEMSHGLNSDVQDIAQQAAQAQANEQRGIGQEKLLTHEGKGKAAAARADILERNRALKEAADRLGVDPAVLIAAEVARSIGQGPSDKFVFGLQGIAEMLGISVIADRLKGKQTPQQGNPGP